MNLSQVEHKWQCFKSKIFKKSMVWFHQWKPTCSWYTLNRKKNQYSLYRYFEKMTLTFLDFCIRLSITYQQLRVSSYLLKICVIYKLKLICFWRLVGPLIQDSTKTSGCHATQTELPQFRGRILCYLFIYYQCSLQLVLAFAVSSIGHGFKSNSFYLAITTCLSYHSHI